MPCIPIGFVVPILLFLRVSSLDPLIYVLGKFLGAIFMPPFLFVLLGFIGLVGMRRYPRQATWTVGLALLSILATSTPLVGSLLIQTVQTACPSIDNLQGQADAVVILGGGVRAKAPEYGNLPQLNAEELERLRHGARIHRVTGRPILVTGGSPEGDEPEAFLMRSVLKEDFGVDTRWIEADSKTTRENARNSAEILSRQGIRRIYLVSQGWHLARAVRAFEAEGLEVIPAGTGCKVLTHLRPCHFLPHPDALAMSYRAVHEWVGMFWYRLISLVRKSSD